MEFVSHVYATRSCGLLRASGEKSGDYMKGKKPPQQDLLRAAKGTGRCQCSGTSMGDREQSTIGTSRFIRQTGVAVSVASLQVEMWSSR